VKYSRNLVFCIFQVVEVYFEKEKLTFTTKSYNTPKNLLVGFL
jgi:hypothetical protein